MHAHTLGDEIAPRSRYQIAGDRYLPQVASHTSRIPIALCDASLTDLCAAPPRIAIHTHPPTHRTTYNAMHRATVDPHPPRDPIQHASIQSSMPDAPQSDPAHIDPIKACAPPRPVLLHLHPAQHENQSAHRSIELSLRCACDRAGRGCPPIPVGGQQTAGLRPIP